MNVPSTMAERLLHFVDSANRNLESSSSNSVFESCKQQHPDGNITAILECVSDALQEAEDERSGYFSSDMVSFLLVVSGALIFFMQTGFAMLCAGCVQLKNVQNTMLKNLLDACGSAIAFFLIGYSIAFGGQDNEGRTFVGKGDHFATGPSPSFWFFGT
jgi:Amt family ammonium transporter